MLFTTPILLRVKFTKVKHCLPPHAEAVLNAVKSFVYECHQKVTNLSLTFLFKLDVDSKSWQVQSK